MNPLVAIWGAAGHARVIRDVIEDLGGSVVALFDRASVAPPWPRAPLHCGPDGFDAWLRTWTGPLPAFVVAIGGQRGADRLALADMMSGRGLEPLTVVHPRAIVARSARLGPGAQILAGANIGSGAVIGEQTIVNSSASVDHDTSLGRGCHVAPGAILCGEIEVGDEVFIGAGAVVGPKLTIGRNAVIGAGAVVLRDVAPGARLWGNPARMRS